MHRKYGLKCFAFKNIHLVIPCPSRLPVLDIPYFDNIGYICICTGTEHSNCSCTLRPRDLQYSLKREPYQSGSRFIDHCITVPILYVLRYRTVRIGCSSVFTTCFFVQDPVPACDHGGHRPMASWKKVINN
jgi:hypothetical protein